LAPVLRPEESGGGGGTAVEDGEDIMSDRERVVGESRGEVVAEGERMALWGVAFGADADVGDDDAAWTRGVSVFVILAIISLLRRWKKNIRKNEDEDNDRRMTATRT